MHFSLFKAFKWVKRKKVKISYILILVHCDFCICTCKTGTAGGLVDLCILGWLEARWSQHGGAGWLQCCLQLPGRAWRNTFEEWQSKLSRDCPSPFIRREFPAFGKIVLSWELQPRYSETGSKGPNSCHGNEGAIGTLFPWQQSRKHCHTNSLGGGKALYLRSNGLERQLMLENWPSESLLLRGWWCRCLVPASDEQCESGANQNWGAKER